MRISDWSSDVCSSDLMTGIQYESTRAGGTRAARADEAGHRYGRCQYLPDDGTHGGVQAARGIQLYDRQHGAVIGRLLQASGNEVGCGRADDAVDLQDDDSGIGRKSRCRPWVKTCPKPQQYTASKPS